MRISPNYKQCGTHIPVLLRVIPRTVGDVCEVGCGFNSTPLLHWLLQGRKLVTYESDPDYYNFARKFQSNNHKIIKIDDWSSADYDRHWGVVFIDHTTSREKINGVRRQRGDDAIKFTNADIMIMHDTEPEAVENYRYNLVFPLYKYRCDWTNNKPWTSVVSNVIDVSKWLD
jgi:hypothetical protein